MPLIIDIDTRRDPIGAIVDKNFRLLRGAHLANSIIIHEIFRHNSSRVEEAQSFQQKLQLASSVESWEKE